jgi:hypothetical protein
VSLSKVDFTAAAAAALVATAKGHNFVAVGKPSGGAATSDAKATGKLKRLITCLQANATAGELKAIRESKDYDRTLALLQGPGVDGSPSLRQRFMDRVIAAENRLGIPRLKKERTFEESARKNAKAKYPKQLPPFLLLGVMSFDDRFKNIRAKDQGVNFAFGVGHVHGGAASGVAAAGDAAAGGAAAAEGGKSEEDEEDEEGEEDEGEEEEKGDSEGSGEESESAGEGGEAGASAAAAAAAPALAGGKRSRGGVAMPAPAPPAQPKPKGGLLDWWMMQETRVAHRFIWSFVCLETHFTPRLTVLRWPPGPEFLCAVLTLCRCVCCRNSAPLRARQV